MEMKKYNLDILFLGGVFKEGEIMKQSKSNVQFAANVLQWNIIEGLDYLNEQPVNLLSAIFIGSYPKYYKKILIQRKDWSHLPGAKDKEVKFWNIPILKKFSRGWSLSKEIMIWAQQKNERKKVIIAYSMDYSILSALKSAKVSNSEIITCLIVPDLPQFMNLSSSKNYSYKLLKNIESDLISQLQKYVDSYVLLTKHMADFLKIQNKPYVVIEGMVNFKDQTTYLDRRREEQEKSRKTILYTGTLNEKYGILNLLKAFELIKDKNYRLQICGTGEAEKDIVEMAKQDNRIDFRGRVSREEAILLQKNATVLINPRNSEGEFTKYSFPSKIMEYLVSGVPTIAYSLPGMPEEYKDYMYFIKDNTVQGIANTIINVCETNPIQLKKFGEASRKFVLSEKNNIRQVEKIMNIL
ncbi:glycosyltransferase [Neobacillus sp. OS1-32]|uniref:Glycosyltransferase n=1 Tax=Neobacillus paridis TaxID=2803862 RepID=A0ABS1TT33_9BACI|nr:MULTISPECIES: glycosyltransferase [Neobacillus]MBL4954460.1 glycosyltransferase [Neobacillus paridis]WML30308.1 glycosyltransferase [Neobacillus sp. OS1-32]